MTKPKLVGKLERWEKALGELLEELASPTHIGVALRLALSEEQQTTIRNLALVVSGLCRRYTKKGK